MWMFYSSVVLLSVIQMHHVLATGCQILSISSPSASTLDLTWTSYTGASHYVLDLRVVNSTSIVPVVVMQPPPSTQRLIQGLRPGHVYQVTLKVFEFVTVVCTDTQITLTVPAMSQITYSQAISSTSIKFEWSSVIGADSYSLYVDELFSVPVKRFNQNFTTLYGQMDGLTPSTTYNCYIYSSNSAGRGAKSNTRTIMTLVQPPTGVNVVSTGKSTARVSWDSVSKVLLYQVAVTDNDNPSNMPVIRNTSFTSMDISNLEPCSNYTVGVSSVNMFLVPGEPSNVLHSTSTINPVTTVSADYSCSGGMVTVTWDLVFGANAYRATAVDGTGASLSCTSPSTSCQITMLKCGEKYQVYVTAISDDCESMSDTTALFETVPCAPANTITRHDCSDNVIVFEWEHTNNTLYYVATALDNNNQVTECMTADNQCFFTNTDCGQYYKYSVYAVSMECNSEASQPDFVRTSPCLPTNVKTATECDSDMLITTWDSAAGALSYTIEAHGNNGKIYNCTSSTNSCAVTGVPCGEHLSVWIVASNDNCSTDRVLGEVAQTVPCTPTSVSVAGECSLDSAKLNWTSGLGSLFYIATAEDTNGNSRICNSMGTNCLIDGLQCGQNYTATVTGTNLKCNSSESHAVTFRTAPCAPTNIEAFRDCDANHALIVWQNHQPTGLYTAMIEDQSGTQLTCTSNTVNNCKITSLPCGKKYNVSVTYDDGNCQSTSTKISMDSVPCGPENVSTTVTCVTGELTVMWNISVPAENYTTFITSATGQKLQCNSTETQCTTQNLLCGNIYRLTVFSVTGMCFSLPSTEVTVHSLPCPPTNVTAVHTCSPNPVPVSWVASDNAKHYSAVAVSGGGHRSECNTNTTSCSFNGLRCGEVYTIVVSGNDDVCTGQLSNTVSLNTEPCPPANVSSQLICSTRAAQVSWSASANAVSYVMTATNNEQTVTCSSSSPNCTLNDLVCGQEYDILVTATDGTCVSNYSAPFRQEQVPCAPGNISTELVCGTNDLTVSWNSSAVRLSYTVTAKALGGDLSPVTCSTNGTSCSLSSLQCGQTYNVSVKASSGGCTGPYSSPQIVETAPCPPQNLTAVNDCGTNSLLASWSASLGAITYTATVTGPGGFSKTCSSSNVTCSFGGLQCATKYNVTVTSHRNMCTSSPIGTVIMTGPCDPVNVTSALQCGSDMATVSWDAASGAVAYTVHAHSSSDHYTSCRSTTTSCQLNQLQCGRVYNLTVKAEDATCNSTGEAKGVLMTAPCSPSIQTSIAICGTNSSLLSWMPMADAKGYIVNATTAEGQIASCSSATASCTLTDLLCSKTYSIRVTARGDQCDSTPGTSTNISTAPCPPAVTSKQYTCESNTAMLSWTKPAGSLSFLAQAQADGYQDNCHTTNTSCVFKNLPCGSDVSVTVQAQGVECNSSFSVSEPFETVPCAPMNVSSTLVCSNHSALVTWVGSSSAIGYNVTTTGQDGHTHHCHTNSTSCLVPDIHCGETYDITVTPYSQTCTGYTSAPYTLKAGLCAPTNVTVSAACEDSTVSWSHVSGADMYISTATAQDGHTHTCTSNSSSSCNFTDLHCGEIYAVTVVTVDRGCRSEPSSAVNLRTALCPPDNFTGEASCDANMLTLTWSPVTGATYVLETVRMDGALSPSEHQTANTTHTLSSLLCGQRYAFRIAAQDGGCRSSYSPAMEISTAPCLPSNLTVRVDCGTNNANFSWAESSGADYYTVEVTGEHGHIASCSSNDTSCAVKLHCGHSYAATLVASTGSCNSSKHTDILFDSAPCLPEDVVAELSCQTNVMNVSWTQTLGSDDYTAWAISTDGHRASCNSTSNTCSIHNLLCGKIYEVAVTSSSIDCSIIAGSDYKVQSAPCKPENPVVEQNCTTNVVVLKWDEVSTTQTYTVNATSPSGLNSICSSNESSCSFLDLNCNQNYTFTITGHTNVCRSDMAAPVKLLTGPCRPVNVSAELNCITQEALVSWSSPSPALTGVQATAPNGHIAICSDSGSSCNLANLDCGQEYTVVVEGKHLGCSGPVSDPTTFITEPCVPMNVSVYYNVSTALVMWSAARGAISYSAQAVTDHNSTVTCDAATTTSCFLHGLQCSKMYNVTVKAQNQACDSAFSETSRLMTEPCPPTNVQASMVCEQLGATVSWQMSHLAVGYVAYFDNNNGHKTSCVGTATDTSCGVSELMCGTMYSVWVKALGEVYNSSDSSVISLTSAPCQASAIKAIMDCEIQSATVSWQPSVGASSYVTMLTASSGHTTSCTTNHTNCLLPPLQCGEQYNVTVKTVGETCNSTAQMAGYLTTEPCVPMNVSVHYNVSTAQVMWDAARGAGLYSVHAVTDQGLTATCNTTNTHCSLTALQCSQIYNITVAANNMACNNTVSSAHKHLMTEPCPPTNVEARMLCEQLTATVSWEQSDLAVSYVAFFDNHSGHRTSCASTDTSCEVSGMMCGTVYSVWVKAVGQEYNSSDSSVVSLTSAPCLPKDIEVAVNCYSDGAAVVSWKATHGVANISVMAVVHGSLQTLCITQHTSCNVTGLSCGETYNLSLAASNEECSLTAPTHTNLTTRPCPPQRVAVDLHCGSRMTVLSWEERPDVELYTASAIKASGGEVKKCNSSGSSCQFPKLDCGETYNLTVIAHIQDCSSEASSPVFIQTEPCQPAIVSAQAACKNEEVQITWLNASGVVNYIVRATGSLGYVENYNTTRSLLSATLPCGQNYTVTVQGQGSKCDSLPSNPVFLKTTPCTPGDVATYVQCESDMGSVSWGPSDGADMYIATATGLDGHTHQCQTSTTSCTWNDLHCGEEYTVVVRAKDGNCTSLPSNSSVIHMDPCVPQNLVTNVNCDMKVVSLSWDAGKGTKSYVVSAEGGGKSIDLSTNDTTAQLSELTCGQNYSLTVTPHNLHCPGNSSALGAVQTWPCAIMGVATTQDCLTNIVMVSWQPSNGSDYYTATLETSTGISQMCMSEINACSVPGLTCGHNFSVSVTASNQQCNITSSHTASLQSVPCVPTNVSVEMDCANNTAVVSWSASRGAVQYSVTAYGSHSNDSCQTSDLSCSLNSLTCGSQYTVTVVAIDDSCTTIPSQTVLFKSGPCPPHNVSAQISCESNDVLISWDTVREADHFLVSLTAETEASSRSCNTSNTECSISNATCGHTFSIEVTSVRGVCRSVHSQTHSIQSAPCRPRGIRGSLDCVSNSALISWDAGFGADSYFVSAVGGDNQAANCTTSTNTTCRVEDLACGVLYNFSVTAKNSECESQPSSTINLQTAPCSLSAITAYPQCHNGSILVKWDLMEGGDGTTLYKAIAEASDLTILQCNNTGTSCTLHGAQCDLHYTIIVSASSEECSGMRSPPYRVSMEPCPPRDVMVNASCEDHTALVSWTPSPVAETYHVVAMAADGHKHTCNTTFSNCSVSELHCDQLYTVYVTASHENCTSKHSQNTTLNTGPCQPSGLSVTFHCINQSASLTWTPSDNAESYYGCAQGGNGDMLYCHTTNPTCTIEGLDCGTLYNFSVQASDGTCNSSLSDPVQSGAVPCPPDAIGVQLLPMKTEIQVIRFNWTQISCESTEYLLHLTGELLGDNQTLFDISSYWNSRTFFEIPLPCSSSYSATVRSRGAAGMSDNSLPLVGKTAPCPPSGAVYRGNSSFATVSWNASVFATAYTVYDDSVSPGVQICNSTGLSCSLTNIASSNLMITASNAAGESEKIRITDVVLHARRRRDLSEQLPMNAPVLDIKQSVPTAVFIEWSKVEAASYYTLLIKKQGSSSEDQEMTVYGEGIIITDLIPNSNYCFSLLAVYSADSSPESEPVCVQTGEGVSE